MTRHHSQGICISDILIISFVSPIMTTFQMCLQLKPHTSSPSIIKSWIRIVNALSQSFGVVARVVEWIVHPDDFQGSSHNELQVAIRYVWHEIPRLIVGVRSVSSDLHQWSSPRGNSQVQSAVCSSMNGSCTSGWSFKHWIRWNCPSLNSRNLQTCIIYLAFHHSSWKAHVTTLAGQQIKPAHLQEVTWKLNPVV